MVSKMYKTRSFLIEKLFLIVYAASLCGLTEADLPADVHKCHAGDVNCIMNVMNDVVRRYPQGNPALGLDSIEMVQIKNITASQANAETPVQFNVKFNTLNMYGMEKCTVQKVEGFERDPLKSKYEVHTIAPEILLRGDYEGSGKILFMTLKSAGKVEIDLSNVRSVTKLKMGTERRDGREYLRIRKSQTIMKPEKMHVNLENLIAGNKEITDTLNEVINQNWRDIWNQLNDDFNNATTLVIRGYLDKIFRTLPYDDFFLSD